VQQNCYTAQALLQPIFKKSLKSTAQSATCDKTYTRPSTSKVRLACPNLSSLRAVPNSTSSTFLPPWAFQITKSRCATKTSAAGKNHPFEVIPIWNQNSAMCNKRLEDGGDGAGRSLFSARSNVPIAEKFPTRQRMIPVVIFGIMKVRCATKLVQRLLLVFL
jgi:hypothetical protein